jgi:hypothetical protein
LERGVARLLAEGYASAEISHVRPWQFGALEHAYAQQSSAESSEHAAPRTVLDGEVADRRDGVASHRDLAISRLSVTVT